jgi:pyrrolidone-carboxylate peptidase
MAPSSTTTSAPPPPVAPSTSEVMGTSDADAFDRSAPARLDGTPTAAPAGAGRAGLPEILLQTPRATVRHGDDPGDFYCEHAFFTASTAAHAPGSSIATNAEGEKLVGFLHVPGDDAAYRAESVADQAARHAGTREVVGAALRGYVEDARRQGNTPTRVLLTGYEPWGSIQNNPTGDFVTHRENIDAAMRQGFGRLLVSSEGRRVGGDDHADIWSYRVRDPATGKQSEVQVEARRLPVTDEAINESTRSLSQAIARFRPHGVLSMGVHGGREFLAEHHADDGGLRVGEDGQQRHDPHATSTRAHPDNHSLGRAILRGSQPVPVGLNDLGLAPGATSLHAFARRRAASQS